MADDERTLGDRVEAALKAAVEQAMRNSNMGQVDAYRINHVISLIEQMTADVARTLETETQAIPRPKAEISQKMVDAGVKALRYYLDNPRTPMGQVAIDIYRAMGEARAGVA